MTEQHHNSEIGVRFVSDEVKRDHRDLENLLAGLTADNNHDDDDDKTRDENASTSTTSQLGELQNRFCWGLVRHLIAMQLFVFPGTESRAKEGSLVAGNRQRESWVIRDQLIEFSRLAPSDPDFVPSADRLGRFLREHIHHVERTDMVAIEKALDGDESERMARDWVRVNLLVPLRVRRRMARRVLGGNNSSRGSRGGDTEYGRRRREKKNEKKKRAELGEEEEEEGDDEEGLDEDEKGQELESPYGTVEELLNAPLEDVRKVWERLAHQ